MKYGSEDRTCIIRILGVHKYHFIPCLYHDDGITVCVYIQLTFAVGAALEMADQVFIGGAPPFVRTKSSSGSSFRS